MLKRMKYKRKLIKPQREDEIIKGKIKMVNYKGSVPQIISLDIDHIDYLLFDHHDR